MKSIALLFSETRVSYEDNLVRSKLKLKVKGKYDIPSESSLQGTLESIELPSKISSISL